MKALFELWNELSDSDKTKFVETMEKDIEDIKFRATHRVVGDPDAGTSFLVPVITFEYPAGESADGGFMQTCCTRVGTDGDCLSSELCPCCDNPPNRFLKGYDCYD